MQLDEEFAHRFALLAFGQSIRYVDLTSVGGSDVHAALEKRGFRGKAIPLPGMVRRDGKRQWLRRDGTFSAEIIKDALACEYVYEHDDGGIIRVFPWGLPSFGHGMMYPSARKSVLFPAQSRRRQPADFSVEAEMFAVDPTGHPLPKSPCIQHGLTEMAEGRRRKLALEVLAATRMRLGRGEPVPLPLAPDHVGLPTTRTIVPAGDFGLVVRRVAQLARAAPVFRTETFGRPQVLFPGSAEAAAERHPSYVACASLTVNEGQYTLGIDPVGTAGATAQLADFLSALLDGIAFDVYDDATGDNVSGIVARHPSFLVSPDHWPSTDLTAPA